MNDHDHAGLIDGLSPSKRVVFDAILEHGPLTNQEAFDLIGGSGDPSRRSRTAELTRMGLVRQASGQRGGKKLWEAVPPAEVEAAAEAAVRRGPRVKPPAERDLETKVAEFNAYLVDPEVIEATEDPTGSATKRERQRARKAIEKARRERRRQLREAEVSNHPALEAIRLRNAVRDAGDLIRSLRVMNEEDWERRTLLGEELVADGEWERILRHITELERQADEAWETIARRCGVESRREVDVELGEDEFEDADYTEIGNGNGTSEVAALIEQLGGTARLALPPGKA